MRRPAMTREQRQHAKEQRALLALRRAAVRYSILGEQKNSADAATNLALALGELEAACDKYTESLGLRAKRKLAGKTIQLRSVP